VPTLQRLGATFSTKTESGIGDAPFPGTLVNGVAQKIAAEHPGIEISVFSGFPFPWNIDRKLERFQIAALQALTDNRAEKHEKFIKEDGKHFIKIARPSVMTRTCVDCHNQYDNRWEKPWKVGDIRSAYQVTMAIPNPYATSPSQYLFIALVAGVSGMLGLFIVLPIINRMSHAITTNTALLKQVQNTNTELKDREMGILEARNQAEQANRAKSKFLSSMSHELRTPLNAILGHVQILQLDEGENPPFESSQSLREILRGGNHLLRLIEQILNLKGIERGELALSIIKVKPDEILWEVVSMLTTLASSRGIHIELEIPPRGTPPVLVDPLRFK
jgi:hypothetical protein